MNVKCVLCIRFECAQRNIDYTHTQYLHVKLFVDLKTFFVFLCVYACESVCVCVKERARECDYNFIYLCTD